MSFSVVSSRFHVAPRQALVDASSRQSEHPLAVDVARCRVGPMSSVVATTLVGTPCVSCAVGVWYRDSSREYARTRAVDSETAALDRPGDP
jgi:hypothetical protein